MSELHKTNIPFDFASIETPLVSPDKCSDEQLLRMIQSMGHLYDASGYGLIAELCKRFESRISDGHNIKQDEEA